MVNNQQLTFEGAMMIVQGNKWIQLKDIERLEKFIQNQQATINILVEELVNAQQQGYVVGFLHKNEHCSLIPKELEYE